jgi:hypothetical protein
VPPRSRFWNLPAQFFALSGCRFQRLMIGDSAQTMSFSKAAVRAAAERAGRRAEAVLAR